MEDKILNEITSFCEECNSKDCCIENECVLYRIEQIVLKEDKKTDKAIKIIENDTDLNSQRQRQRLLGILKGKE